jgi:transcriptional regulator with GAF, ATPase, and Fis domain
VCSSDLDLVLEDSAVSRRHCEIQLTPDGYVIRDLGSTNGTLVQGVKVTEAFLDQGTDFQLGKTKFVFCPLQEATEYTVSRRETMGRLIGKSFRMRRVFHLAETYAPTDASILIQGDTGTGKEVLAEEIHRHSHRKNKPFVVIDCASLAREIVESELFGHTKGAFTGANADRIGVFEHADGGTVLLDEIGDLGPDLQPKLLRVLEKREIRRVGSNQIRNIDVRIISATNRKLESEVNVGKFREDLLFRLSVVRIEMPPLRKRKEDIPLLTLQFLKEFHGDDALAQVVNFDKTMEAFCNYEWPGNVRELRNLVEIAFYGERRPVDLGAFLYVNRTTSREDSSKPDHPADRPLKVAKGELIMDFEKDYIGDLLKKHGGNISKAAREAGIERAYLQRLIKKYELK